jgi:hypothetical protein
MKISGSAKVHELLTEYPFLEEFLAAYNPKFEMLRNRMARATVGRVATLKTAAGIASIDFAGFVEAIADEIERHTGDRPETDDSAASAAPGREERLQILKEIIADLHAGGDVEAAKRRFAEAIQDIEASEIAAMEEELIRGGLPVSEVQRLCDVHVGTFRHALDEHEAVQGSPEVIGRKVQYCHPPKSVHMVQGILDAFRTGRQSIAELWIQLHGKFIHIRYFCEPRQGRRVPRLPRGEPGRHGHPCP